MARITVALPVTICIAADGDDKRTVLTQAGGVFGLPLRITGKEQTTTKQKIDAFGDRTKRTGSIEISIPQDLGKNNTIAIKH